MELLPKAEFVAELSRRNTTYQFQEAAAIAHGAGAKKFAGVERFAARGVGAAIEQKTPFVSFAGYVLATLNCDKKGQTNCHIISLAVYPEFQRRGFAHVLMQSVEAFVKERYPSTHHLVLHVRKHNKAAYNLYCKLQYGRTKVVKGYYTTPKEDAYEMKKYLEPKEQPPPTPQQEEKE